VHRVLQEIGGNKKTKLTKCGKAMLIYSILNENKNKLKFLSKSDENIDLSMTAITEFKKHNIPVDRLSTLTNNIEDEYLKAKLEDIYLVYDKFQNSIKEKFLDENDCLTYLADNLKNTNIFDNAIIFIDEFVRFYTSRI